MWCIQTIDSEYRTRMYDILNLYEEDYDPKKPLICLDEKPKQLLRDKRITIPMKSGYSEKYDYEYVRNGTANIFMAVEFKAGKRVTQVTKRRTMTDFAQFVKFSLPKNILKLRSSDWLRIISISTKKSHSTKHSVKRKQKRFWTGIEFHYTPKHASWLNAAEIEINVMDIECTDRRIGDMETLTHDVGAWTKRRNDSKKKIEWKFTRKNADEKMSKYYVK